jgi:hypothetical protein
MPNVDKNDLFDGIEKMGFWRTTVYYIIDSKFRKSVSVRDWYLQSVREGTFTAPQFDANQKGKCILALAWVKQTLSYTGDVTAWGMTERWQLPWETMARKTGDCEDGALLLLEVLRQNGIPANQLYLVAGDVEGGGHAYVVWRSDEDMLEYVLDWCYWPRDSLVIPYELNVNYFHGTREWFRFNWEGAFVKKR